MITRALVLFVTFVAGAGLVARQNRPEQVPARATFDQFPMHVPGWRGQNLPPMDEKILAVLGVDDYMNRFYVDETRRAGAGLYIGYYKSQRQGDSIHSPLNCLPGAGWEPMSQAYLTIPVSSAAGAGSISVNRYVIQKGLDRQLVLYWYQSHGRAVASEYWSKLYLIRDAVRINRTDAALVRVIVPMPPNVDGAEAQAEQEAVSFVKTIYPRLSEYVPS
jgi:EpsI family protein